MESTTTMRTTTTAAAAAATTSLLLTSGASGRVNALLSLRALRGLLMVINAFLLLLLVPFRIRFFRSSTSSGVGVGVGVGGGGGGGGIITSSSSSSSSMAEKQQGKDEKQEFVSHHHRKPQVLRLGYLRRSNLVACSEDHDVVKRRSLAVKRANHDEDTRSAREVSFFVTSRGDTLFTQSWTPVASEIRGLVVLLHGLNEHSGRYSDFAKKLNANGYKVYGMDWTGHGGSDGLHGYVHSLDDAVNDLKAYLEKVIAENPGIPCFCFGHSTGGAIVLKALLDPKIETLVDGVVVTSPAVGVQPSHPIFGVLAPIFSYLLPKYQFSAANKNGVTVSRDPEALIAKYSDPLVFTGAIRVRTGSEILRISAYLRQNANRLNVPLFVLHGTDDAVTNPEASQKFYEEASSTDKSIKLYKGLLHDILFEPEKETVTNDIIEWLNSRVKI